MNATYNMMYFYDCLAALDNILVRGAGADTTGAIASAFDRECISKLEGLVDLLATDIRQCTFDIKNLSDYNCNLVEVLKNFISHIMDCHSNIKSDISLSLVALCNVLMHNLNSKVNSAIESYKEKVRMSLAVVVMEVACFSAMNFPNGDNRIFQARSDTSLIELVMQVENRYRMSPITLTYINEANERVVINSDIALKRAIYDSYKESANKGKVIIRFIIGLPVNIESTDLTLDMFRATHPVVNTEFAPAFHSWTNLSKRDEVLADLKRCTGFSIAELKTIYYAFCRITQRRFLQKEEGYVTLPEFTALLSKAIKNQDLLGEMFNALDKNRAGRVDFRDLVCGLSVLQYGLPEERLRFAFLAYDMSRVQGIDKKDFFMLVKSSVEVKNGRMTNYEINQMVDKVFAEFDRNRKGKLNYDEFKGAVNSRTLEVKPFWVTATFKFGEAVFNDKFVAS
eukprot:TRINITY_DN10550_c0_g4_i1.p2 TRINITY_DN10550_c0_g4~~TRINITY_DN10550_c0_g4_i1.p2  ORF type:complete len:454 (-),score=118.84 TRINITY_DN10550_c0_g4_i1:100-1461(-)